MEQSGLLDGLVAWDAGKVLDHVARVAAGRLSDNVTGLDMLIGRAFAVDCAAQLWTAIAFCKGPDQCVLA
jgi:hypothetical protein